MDSNTQGDTMSVSGTSTGHQWLDLSITENQSYNIVTTQLQQGGDGKGFRYAIQAEMLSLWDQVSITDNHFSWSQNGEWKTITNLAEKSGTSILFDPSGIATHAAVLVEGDLTLDSALRCTAELSYHPDGMQIRTLSENYTLDRSFSSVHYMRYLVQAEPVTGFTTYYFHQE